MRTVNGRSVSLRLGPEQGLALIGPSGSGKSLVLRALADLDPVAGELSLDGRACRDHAGPDWRRQVVYVAAESAWWEESLSAHLPPGASLMAAALGLTEALLSAPIGRLSTGERQRGAVLRALALGPRVLLLDEPTGPLDPDSTARVEAALLAEMTHGTSLVIATHDAGQAGRLGCEVMRLT